MNLAVGLQQQVIPIRLYSYQSGTGNRGFGRQTLIKNEQLKAAAYFNIATVPVYHLTTVHSSYNGDFQYDDTALIISDSIQTGYMNMTMRSVG